MTTLELGQEIKQYSILVLNLQIRKKQKDLSLEKTQKN